MQRQTQARPNFQKTLREIALGSECDLQLRIAAVRETNPISVMEVDRGMRVAVRQRKPKRFLELGTRGVGALQAYTPGVESWDRQPQLGERPRLLGCRGSFGQRIDTLSLAFELGQLLLKFERIGVVWVERKDARKLCARAGKIREIAAEYRQIQTKHGLSAQRGTEASNLANRRVEAPASR